MDPTPDAMILVLFELIAKRCLRYRLKSTL